MKLAQKAPKNSKKTGTFEVEIENNRHLTISSVCTNHMQRLRNLTNQGRVPWVVGGFESIRALGLLSLLIQVPFELDFVFSNIYV